MKTKIKQITQIYGNNVLDVEYKSGFHRYVGLDGWGFATTKTQDDFMKAATRREAKHSGLFPDSYNGYTIWEIPNEVA